MTFGRLRKERGAALVEAALVLPILLLLTFGIWTTARAWQVNNSLQHSAREAARFGATIDPWDPATSPGEILAVAAADLSSASIDPGMAVHCAELLAPGNTSVCDPTHQNVTTSDQVVVRLEIPNWELQFLFFRMHADLSGTAVARFEAS